MKQWSTYSALLYSCIVCLIFGKTRGLKVPTHNAYVFLPRDLVDHQDAMIKAIEEYADAETKRLEALKLYAESLRSQFEDTGRFRLPSSPPGDATDDDRLPRNASAAGEQGDEVFNYIGHPINAFHTIKKWKSLADMSDGKARRSTSELGRKLTQQGMRLPTQGSTKTALTSLLELQRIHDLPIPDMQAGNILGRQAARPCVMKADEFLLQASVRARESDDPLLAVEFLAQAMTLPDRTLSDDTLGGQMGLASRALRDSKLTTALSTWIGKDDRSMDEMEDIMRAHRQGRPGSRATESIYTYEQCKQVEASMKNLPAWAEIMPLPLSVEQIRRLKRVAQHLFHRSLFSEGVSPQHVIPDHVQDEDRLFIYALMRDLRKAFSLEAAEPESESCAAATYSLQITHYSAGDHGFSFTMTDKPLPQKGVKCAATQQEPAVNLIGSINAAEVGGEIVLDLDGPAFALTPLSGVWLKGGPALPRDRPMLCPILLGETWAIHLQLY